MPRLTLSFLGCFHVCLDDRPVTDFKSNKVRALLAYLAVEADRPHRREVLAGLLWPDRTDRDALSNLRYALASLRRTIGDHTAGPPFLLITPQTIQFNPASDHWLDVAELGRQIADSRWQIVDGAKLVSAQSLYRGSFLAGFSIGDAAPFEEWALLRREQISLQVMSLLGSLAAYHEARGDYPAAQAYARQQIALEPWSEEAHRTLMRVLTLDGQRSAALHQYATCCNLLRDELGVEPAEETLALYEIIRAGTLVVAKANEQADRGSQGNLPTSLPVTSAPPVVARESQLAQLDSSLAAALAGAGRVIFVTGEAGSGKTILLGEFSRRAMQAHANLLVAAGTCDAVTGIGDSYLPFREILQLLTGDIEAKRASAILAPESARRLWAAMPDAVQALVEKGPGLIDTFVPGADLALRAEAFAGQSRRGTWQAGLEQLLRRPAGAARNSGPSVQQLDLFDQVTHVLQALARRHPLCLVLDDLQWADAGSVNLLFHLGRRLAGSRILVAAAYRPDAIAPHPEGARHPLEPVVDELQRIFGADPVELDECEGRPFVEALLDTEPNRLGADFRTSLLRQTEGHPLFTVELLRGLEERGNLVRDDNGCWTEGSALHWAKLPARVEAVIAERNGRLSAPCQALLAAASVEGQEFTVEVMARVLGVGESELLQCLCNDLSGRHRLVVPVSLRRLGMQKLSRYRFRHHLFQQYFYHHLDAVRRAHLHDAVGNTLELLSGEAPDELELLAPRLAWHFEAAGLVDRAAAYYLRAGNRAVWLAAHEEAISHLTHGLDLLEGLSGSPERVQLKLDLQLALVSPLAFARGFLDPERIQALERAYETSQHPVLSDSPKRGVALATVACFALWSAEPERALQLGEQFLCLAERSRDLQDLRAAHFLLGAARWLRGELVAAHEHLEEALARSDRRSHHPVDLIFGMPVGIMGLAWQSTVLWLLGYPDRASRHLEETLAAARDSAHPMALAFARSTAAAIHFLIGRDTMAAWRHTEALRPLSEKGAVFGAWADSLAGREPHVEGQDEESLRQMRQGMASYQMLGGGFGRGIQLLLLAQRYTRTGQAEAGLGALDQALAWMDRTGMQVLEAEAHRMRGELLLRGKPAQGDASDLTQEAKAEACFRRAIAVARQQEARWWELRATISLHRLLEERHGPPDASQAEARQMLAEVYGWFSEGFDTPDLREARALLQEVSQGHWAAAGS